MDGTSAPSRLGELVRWAEQNLVTAGVPSPRVDATRLAEHVFSASAVDLVIHGDRLVDATNRECFIELVRRRAAREPLQYLMGSAAFAGVEVPVGPGAFIPRPETEQLVELAVAGARARGWGPDCVVDLCAGPGTISLALAHIWPQARIIAIERDPAAFDWLTANTAAIPAITAVCGDATEREAVRAALAGEKADVVVANPPYIPLSWKGDLAAEVEHDPEIALYGGPDGLAVIEPLIPVIAEILAPGGIMVLEHDQSHQQAVIGRIVADGRFTAVDGRVDLAGRDRFVVASRKD